jgi:SAM-dependent methyltransferase
MHVLHEPYRSQFTALLGFPEASRDIHGDRLHSPDGEPSHLGDDQPHRTATAHHAFDEYIGRELDRADMHRRRLIPLLAKVGRAERILDFGCGSAGTTIALALSESLSPSEVIGVDVNSHAIAAARVRAEGCGVERIARFRTVEPGPLSFADGEFDLAVAVSVLEFITDAAKRRAAVEELARVVRPGGFVFIAIPRPSLREYHTGSWFGDLRRPRARPWSSSARHIQSWLADWELMPRTRELASLELENPFARLLARSSFVRALLPWATRWNKLLFRRP